MKWWTKSWNPVVGCTKCSPACENCYAETRHTQRHKALLAGKKVAECYRKPFGQVQFLPERLENPLHWKTPQRIFVGNMGDLFHEVARSDWRDKIFDIMAQCPQHTFMLLTKRPLRMNLYVQEWLNFHGETPLPNVWLGTTIWDQPSLERALPFLLRTPAALRFLSIEPMLGPVVIPPDMLKLLGWLICGGETGPGARPMHPDWARSLRDQCQAAGVPFFFKQWGEWAEGEEDGKRDHMNITASGANWDKLPVDDALLGEARDAMSMLRVGSSRAGRLLDGQEWSEVPRG